MDGERVDAMAHWLDKLEAGDDQAKRYFGDMLQRKGRAGFERATLLVAKYLGPEAAERARRLFAPLVTYDTKTPAPGNRATRRMRAAIARRSST